MNSRKARNNFPRRGYVYRVKFDPARGHEIKKTRPAVIVSNDHMNKMSKTVLVMPITSGQYDYYFRVTIKKPKGGVTKRSVIATEQIRAIDKQRLSRKLGQLHKCTIKEIEQAIRDHFGLPESNMLP